MQNVSKPQQYIGCEYGLKKEELSPGQIENRLKFLLSFPDTYQIGMSNFAVKILFEIIESIDGLLCDRVFLPEDDCAALMEKIGYTIHSINYMIEAKKFDVIGFTLEYELNYSNVLHLLALAGIAVESKNRGETDPIIIAGGSACVNPEPMADFIDVFFIGDGEQTVISICETLKDAKKHGASRKEKIEALSKIKGAYVPSYFEAVFDENGAQAGLKPVKGGAAPRVKTVVIPDLNDARHPLRLMPPNFETVFNRGVVEVARGCKNACRFCQAGYIYRPYRERSVENIKKIIKEIFINNGYTEFTLSALTATDHAGLKEIIDYTLNLNSTEDEFKDALFSVSLPSQRVSAFSVELAGRLSKNKKSGLTFAPEAGSQRMRDIINKNVSGGDIFSAAAAAVEAGYKLIKLYFMIGLPFETDEDLLEIAAAVSRVVSIANEKKARGFSVNVTFSTFVPKPHTPFQWARQIGDDEIIRRQNIIRSALKKHRQVCMKFTRCDVTTLESAFARGSRVLTKVLLAAHKAGCRFDAWDDKLNIAAWRAAFKSAGLDLDGYAAREIKQDEFLPWSVIDTGVKTEFLAKEYAAAREGKISPICAPGRCRQCGVC